MPLPLNTSLVLQSLPQPGDSLYSKPKHAMVVRMSAETFEALENPQGDRKLEVEFSKDRNGFYIGGSFFPATHTTDVGQHQELYLRLPSAARPNAPLKVYGNIVGKLMVERKLGKQVEETVRDRTLEAEKQRTERKAIYLENPPDLSGPKAKKVKKKETPLLRRPAVPASSYAKPPPVTTASSSSKASQPPTPRRASPLPPPLRNASPLPPAPAPSKPTPHTSSASHSSGPSSDTRARLIHCLAIRPRTQTMVVAMCAGKEPSASTKREILSLLEQAAELVPVAKTSDPNPNPLWQLKLESWREVRPYEWATLKDEERRNMARQARKAYQDLGIPTSDPIWDLVKYRSSDDPASASSSKAIPSARAPVEKNGVLKSSKKTKTGEGTRKKVADIMIPAKDESSKGKARDLDESSAAGTPTSSRPAIRRQPGSGYKVKQSATPPLMEPRPQTPQPVPKKPADSREREPKREARTKLPPMSPPAHIPPTQTKKKLKDGQSSSAQRLTAEDRRDERTRERERDRTVDEKPRVKVSPSPAPPPLPSFKRKKPMQDEHESEYSEREASQSASASKRRKLEDTQPSQMEKSRGRDLSLPKKPVLREPSPLAPPPPKIKKEASPLSIAFSPPAGLPPRPSAADRSHLSASSSSSPSMKSGKPAQPARPAVKNRRKSPIYTSSDDDSEHSVPSVRGRAAPSEEPPAKRIKVATHTPRFKARPMPTDSAGLRKYYRNCWKLYDELYQDQLQRRARIQRILRQAEGKDRDRTEGTDDDMDDDLSPEVLGAFMDDLKAVTTELHKVRHAYERLGGKGDTLGNLVDVC